MLQLINLSILADAEAVAAAAGEVEAGGGMAVEGDAAAIVKRMNSVFYRCYCPWFDPRRSTAGRMDGGTSMNDSH